MQTINNPVAAEPVLHCADSKDEDGSTSIKCDPWNPELPPPPPAIYEASDFNVQLKMIFEYEAQNDKILSDSRAKSIISPDRTPQTTVHQPMYTLRGIKSLRVFFRSMLLSRMLACISIFMHKYLEDNLLTDNKHLKHSDIQVDYIYKLIHLLSLPEMKTFLDAIKLLANHTENVVDELWNYIKEGKLFQTAIMLLAAQKQLRSKGTGNLNGFDIIKLRIFYSTVSRELQGSGLEKGKNCKAHKLWKEKKYLFRNASVLVSIILRAGEALDGYVQTHSEVPHHKVLQYVSSVLKDHDFSPTGKGIGVGDLYCHPYDCGYLDTTETAMKSSNLKVVGKQTPKRQEDYMMFIPLEISVAIPFSLQGVSVLCFEGTAQATRHSTVSYRCW